MKPFGAVNHKDERKPAVLGLIQKRGTVSR